jgi:hypothetical protein
MCRSKEIYQDFLLQKQEIESHLVEPGVHAKGLSDYMVAVQMREWGSLSQWLHIANGIKNLDYDGVDYGNGFFICSDACEYEIEQQELYQALLKEISVFSFA